MTQIKGAKVVLLEGSFNPHFALSALKQLEIKNYLIICLHTPNRVRNHRLTHLRHNPELVNDDRNNWDDYLKNTTQVIGGKVIESHEESPLLTAHSILKVIIKYLASKIEEKDP